MNKIVVGIIGILLLVGIVFISGCISTPNNAGKVLYDSDVKDSQNNIYIPIDNQAVQVIITDAKGYSMYSTIEPEYTSIQIGLMKVNGESTQQFGNYIDNVKDIKRATFEDKNSATINIAAGTQCLALVPNMISCHVKVVTV